MPELLSNREAGPACLFLSTPPVSRPTKTSAQQRERVEAGVPGEALPASSPGDWDGEVAKQEEPTACQMDTQSAQAQDTCTTDTGMHQGKPDSLGSFLHPPQAQARLRLRCWVAASRWNWEVQGPPQVCRGSFSSSLPHSPLVQGGRAGGPLPRGPLMSS